MRFFHLTKLLLVIMATSNICYAGGCLPGEDCYKEPTPPPPVKEMRRMHTPEETCSGWGSRMAVGAPVWLFQEENTEVGGGVYYDAYSKCHPLNLRVGGEITHMNAGQPNARGSAEVPGEEARLTFIRVPFAVEYMREVADNTLFFLGLGPDIIHTANDISETSVGLHLSARALRNFTENWGVAIEGGYMWGEVESDTGDVDLDNTFVTTSLSYTF